LTCNSGYTELIMKTAFLIAAFLANQIAGAGVVACRVDVSPSGGSFDEKPQAVVVGQAAGAEVTADSGNRGDWNIKVGKIVGKPAGTSLFLANGVGIPSLNELLPQNKRGCLGTGDKLTVKIDAGLWVCGATANGGAEANYDFGFAYFPFAEGWIGAHVAANGQEFLAKGNLPEGTTMTLTATGSLAGEILLKMPGIDSLEDGMLFTVPEANGDDCTAVGPLDDGSGWYIRVADEDQNFRAEQRVPFGFVFIPYGLPGVVAGRVGEDGSVLNASGDFAVQRVAGGRYEVFLPDYGEQDGVLLVQVTKLNPTGVEDNAMAWAYDKNACGGRGGFVVESYDQPPFANQDVKFCFAFIPYENQLRGEIPKRNSTFAARKTWSETMLAARDELAKAQGDTETFRPWFSPTLRKGSKPLPVDLPVRNVKRLWLVVDSLDGSDNDHSAWADAQFVLADGTSKALSQMAWLYGGVGYGKLEKRAVKLSDGDHADAIYAHAPSAILVPVPENAVRFTATAGLATSANDKGSVRFMVSDRRDRLPAWRETYLPVLRQQFPREMARLQQTCSAGGGIREFQFAGCEPQIKAGIGGLAGELGDFADQVPARSDDSLRSLLGSYEQSIHLLDKLTDLQATAWDAVPRLGEVLDYPKFTQNELEAKLRRLRQDQPDTAGEIVEREKLVAAAHQECVAVFREALAGNELATARLERVADGLQEVAEWADRSLGWTTYHRDNHRSAVSREVLPEGLHLAWSRAPMAPPAPAWPPPRTDNPSAGHFGLEATLTYDRAYHPVLAQGRAVFSAHATDAVVCLDLTTGRELWRTALEGPPRLAPTIAHGRVYVGSDDGYLYCLDFATGREQWRYHPGGEDRRMMGNGRVISQWPLRSGVCVDDGVAYVCAGLFPTLGTYLCAVDARTGKELWKQSLGVSPQGYLLATPARLFVPTGRTPYQVFDRTGKRLGSLGRSQSWGKDLPGGCCAIVVNETLATGPGEGGKIHLFDLKSTESIVRTPGRALVVDGRTAYMLGEKEVTALARDQYVRGQGPKKRWISPCAPADVMLKVGDRLVLGGEKGIEIFAAGSGQRLEALALPPGRLEGLAFHAGSLLASMADGTIHCFQTGTAASVAVRPEHTVPACSAASLAQAKGLLAWCGFHKGWILVDGAESAELAVGLAQAGDLRVVVCERDAAKADSLRTSLCRSGLLGTKLAVHALSSDTLPYRPYLFNVIVAGSAPEKELFRVLRPLGGRLVAGNALSPSVPGKTIAPPAGFPCAFERGNVPGSAEWTHVYGDPGNTACSNDRMSFGEFSVLWYGRPGPRFMFERHIKGAAPLYSNGTILVNGKDYTAGVDAYNGAMLWETHIPGSGRMALLKDCGNMVVADNRLYNAVDNNCLVFGARSGQELARYPVSRYSTKERHWGYVAAWDDLLIGSSTRENAELTPGVKEDYDTVWYQFKPVVTSLDVFGLNRADGTPRWRYVPKQGVVLNPTFGIVDGLVCFVESTNPATRDDEDGKITLAELFRNGPRLTALKVATGDVAWSVPIDLAAFQHAIYLSGKDGVLVLTGSRHDMVGKEKLIQYQMVGVSCADGKELWRNDNTPSRANILNGGHGEQTQHPTIVGDVVYGPGFARKLHTGEEMPGWKWNKSPQCATVSSSSTCAFSRQGGNPTIADLATGKETKLTRVTRPSCWINTLPVGGLVVIPEGSSGCTCGYSIQTTLALAPVNR
jgi:outer membrane protein assembly factor BamB